MKNEGIEYRPSGSMCARCRFSSLDCSRLDFLAMKVIGTDPDGTKKVRCEEFERKPK